MRPPVAATTTTGVVAGFAQDGMPTRLVFGTGTAARVAIEVELLGAAGITVLATPSGGRHAAALAGTAVPAVHLIDRTEGPAALAPAIGADHAIVALGGERAMTVARAVAGLTGRPLVAVPTSYANGEARRGTGATAPLPATIVYDPALTRSLPTTVTAVSGFAAIARAVRLLCDGVISPLTELAAVEAVRYLADGARDAVLHPAGLRGRSRALYGAHLVAIQLARTPGAAAEPAVVESALAHATGLHPADVEAALLPARVAQAASRRPLVLASVAEALGHDDALTGVLTLAADLGVPTGLPRLLPDPAARARAVHAVEGTVPADDFVLLHDAPTPTDAARRLTGEPA